MSSRIFRYQLSLLLVCAITVLTKPSFAEQPKCLFVSSYHQGYAWSDGVEQGLRASIGNRCVFRQFNMDTKRNKSPENMKQSALEAKKIIEEWQPDVVITADDNAAQHLIMPYYKDSAIPFVFCGVNWTADEYGFPYSNVTGMIEVAPINAMLNDAVHYSKGNRATYIGADTETERKNLARIERETTVLGIQLESKLVKSIQEWLTAYREAQSNDFIIVGSYAGIQDWDSNKAAEAIVPMTNILSVTNHEWMMPVTMLGYTKIPQEQGEWAGEVAISILNGRQPSDIPIVSNRKWDIWINKEIYTNSGILFPVRLMKRAKRFN